MTPAIGGVIVANGDDERVELTVFGAVLTPDTEIELIELRGGRP